MSSLEDCRWLSPKHTSHVFKLAWTWFICLDSFSRLKVVIGIVCITQCSAQEMKVRDYWSHFMRSRFARCLELLYILYVSYKPQVGYLLRLCHGSLWSQTNLHTTMRLQQQSKCGPIVCLEGVLHCGVYWVDIWSKGAFLTGCVDTVSRQTLWMRIRIPRQWYCISITTHMTDALSVYTWQIVNPTCNSTDNN